MECVRPLLNGGVAPSKEACCAALDVLYKRWVQNGDNRAFQVFGVHFSPAVVTEAHRNLRDELARFAEVLREVGLLPRSAPPATMTSASPYWIRRIAMPTEWLAVAQADTAEKLGPLMPVRIDRWPETMLMIVLGT